VLLYLHKLRIVHRDIKPANVLCEKKADGSIKVCLADFGLAVHAVEMGSFPKLCGTRGFIAPEMFERPKTPDTSADLDQLLAAETFLKSDIFSYGMLIYTMALGRNPLMGATEEVTILKNARGIIDTEKVSRLSNSLQELLRWSTARSPYERCSILDAAEHAWFHDGLAGEDDTSRGDSISWVVFQQESRRREEKVILNTSYLRWTS
jgi:polo-like kinase 1